MAEVATKIDKPSGPYAGFRVCDRDHAMVLDKMDFLKPVRGYAPWLPVEQPAASRGARATVAARPPAPPGGHGLPPRKARNAASSASDSRLRLFSSCASASGHIGMAVILTRTKFP